MSKTYQNSKIDMPDGHEIAVPEQVNVVMAEVAADMREGLLALAVGAGLQVMTALMEAASPRWPGRGASTTANGPPSGTATSGGR